MTLYAKDYENEDTLTSTNVAVFNMDKGLLVYGKSEHEKVAPGSSAKIMTAILALELFESNPDTILTVPASALRGLEGSAVLSLKADEQISAIDLIHATLIAGMNDAANTLAIAIGGSIAGFTALMNNKAKELGAINTMYANATGLTSTSYTTAYDVAKIAAYAYENALFMEICSKRAYQVAATNLHEAVTIYTKNSFLTPQSDYYYKYAEGICTSYSNTDGAQLVSATSNGNYAYVCVAFGSMKDENGTIPGYSEVKSLLSWASSNFGEKKVLDKSQIICELPVRAGKDVAHVLVVPYQSVYAFLDKDTDLSKITLSKQLYYERLDAPVQKGDCVGTLTIILDGVPIGTTSLIAKSTVRQSASGKLLLFLEAIVTSKIFLIAALIALPILAFYSYRRIKRYLRRKRRAAKKSGV
jgi:D-alanyl-D-alanine carboxypeptidase (penicillin-binding protein 5/6)